MKIKNLLFILLIVTIGFIGINNVSAEENYGLFVNGEEFTSEKTTINCGEGTATYDHSTNTLTLNNATITNGNEHGFEIEDSIVSVKTAIFYTQNYELTGDEELYDFDYDFSDIYETLKVVLTGTNTIETDYYPIQIENANLIIDGTGSLNITLNPKNSQADTYSSYDYGNIRVDGNLTIKNVTINITNENEEYENDDYNSYFMRSMGLTEIKDANITMNGVIQSGIDVGEAPITITDSDINIKSINIEAISNFEYDYDHDYGETSAISATAITINGDSNINIDGFINALYVPEGRVIGIESGNIDMKHVEYTYDGALSLDDYEGKIYGGYSMDMTDGEVVSKSDFLKYGRYYSFVKMGDFTTHNITSESYNSMIRIPSQAIPGATVLLDNYAWGVYKITSVKVYKASDNTDITNEVNLEYNENWDNYYITMPEYDIHVKVLFKNIYNTEITTMSTKLTKYNAVKISWDTDDYATGYYIYYKKATATTWTRMIWTSKKTYTKTGLASGTKYNFKVVPTLKLYNADDQLVKIPSTKYKILSTYTLKKMTKPTLWHYSSTKIKMRWTKIDGASGYQIAKSSTKAGTYTIIRTTKPTSSSYKISQSTKQYWYKIRAFKTVNGKKVYAPWSDPVKKINTAE